MPLAPLHREPDARRLPAIAYLEVIFPTPTFPNGRTIGTGCLIAPRLILTAAHIVYDHQQGGQAVRVFVSLPTLADTIDATDVDFPRQWREPRNPQDISLLSPVDCGVVVLPDSVAASVAPLPFRADDDDTLGGELLSVAGYPAFPPDGSARGSLWGASFNVVQGGDLPDEAARREGFRLFYPVDTLPGQSGAPVYAFDAATNQRTVVGVHTSFVPFADETELASALRIDDRVDRLLQDWVAEFGGED
jgi:V8-like Glu-specific endopeptidase